MATTSFFGAWWKRLRPWATHHELSLYASEHYWQGPAASFRRLSLRIDGFVSLRAPARGGQLQTKPLVFEGGNLTLNASTSGGKHPSRNPGRRGPPIPGYALADCAEIFGDELSRVVRWRNGGDVRPLSGKTVRLRFVLKDADLYAFQFVAYQPEEVRPRAIAAAPAGGM